MASDESPEDRANKRNAIVTYNEIANIHVRLAEIIGKLDKVPDLANGLVQLEIRVRALELSNAAASTRRGTWEYAGTLLNTVILTAIALLTYFHS